MGESTAGTKALPTMENFDVVVVVVVVERQVDSPQINNASVVELRNQIALPFLRYRLHCNQMNIELK